ncbi:unnamed protein product [Trichobilharzia szidati]|nr:unnamed protein product [Trichobilharzia szidati]
MKNYSKFDNLSPERSCNSSPKWSSPEHHSSSNQYHNKSINSNRHTPNHKYMMNNQYYSNNNNTNIDETSTATISNDSKIQIFKSIDADETTPTGTNQQNGIISMINTPNNTPALNGSIDIEHLRYPLREAMNQDLIDLLRSQISKLLEENEKHLSRIDDYRQKITLIERENREAAADPSNELIILQTELGEARMREAELTVAFEELQHRITAIDRLIETDPEMENFFNAVTISPTSLSLKKPSSQANNNTSQNNSPAKYPPPPPSSSSSNTHHSSPQHNLSDVEDQRMAPYLSDENPQKIASPSSNKSMYSRSNTNNNNNNTASSRMYSRLQNESYPTHFTSDTDGEYTRNIQRSGLDSPQSDSGCSLASHTTSDGRDGITTPASGRANLGIGIDAYDYSSNSGGRRLTQPQYSFQSDINQQTKSPSRRDKSRAPGGAGVPEDEDDLDMDSKSNRPRGFVSLLRRSRSSAADHVTMHGFRSELVSPCSNDTIHFNNNNNRGSIDTPTPTESCHSETEPYETGMSEKRLGDRLSRLRASLRQSFGWPTSKPDFRMEAFAARQGEARALLKLRETRMDVLRVQSRCQTLQRHIDRLEAINSFRMSELEDAVANDRELRQEIRNLQTRIFQLEAEHREFKVGQRIKEMELMSKLAESNMRLSHAEMTNQQAIVWSQLNKAHEAAVDLLTPAHSQTSLISPGMITMDSPSISRYSSANSGNNNNTNNKDDVIDSGRGKSSYQSVSRYGDLRRDVSGRKSDLSKPTVFTEFSDGQYATSVYESTNERRLLRSDSISSQRGHQQQHQQHQHRPPSHNRQHHHSPAGNRDRSIDSMSELRLMPEISITAKSSDINR